MKYFKSHHRKYIYSTIALASLNIMAHYFTISRSNHCIITLLKAFIGCDNESVYGEVQSRLRNAYDNGCGNDRDSVCVDAQQNTK